MDIFVAAGRVGDLERVRDLTERNAALVHAEDTTGTTPLLCAASYGHTEVARYLLDHGAAVNHRGARGRTALLWASCHGHTGVVVLLLQRGADVTVTDADQGWTPLIVAAVYGRDDDVYALLEHGGSDVDAVDHGGRTACHWACNDGHSGVLTQLLAAGIDPTLRDGYSCTPIDLAALYRHHDCVRRLQEWDRAYLLQRVRRVRDAPSTPPSTTPQHGS